MAHCMGAIVPAARYMCLHVDAVITQLALARCTSVTAFCAWLDDDFQMYILTLSKRVDSSAKMLRKHNVSG